MTTTTVLSADWFRAATLRERMDGAHPSWRTRGAPAPTERGGRALAQWRSQSPFEDATLFTDRLRRAGITEADLRHLLDEPLTSLQDRFAGDPAWMEEIERAYAGTSTPPDDADVDDWGMLLVARPLLRRARARLREGIAALLNAHPSAPFDRDTAEALVADAVPDAALSLLTRTLTLELHVAKLRGDLAGDTPAARFQSFVRRLAQPEIALALWREYPVLARSLITLLDQWVTVSLEILRHLAEDWSDLCARFSPAADPGPLAALSGGDGDRHREGRAVRIATFASGLRLVYKPRSLAVDEAFQGLLGWLNTRGAEPDFRTLDILNRPDHGWVEFVERQPCAGLDEARRFYTRQGSYLALFYALQATDLHHENVIASGEHPVPIDLETLLHPELATPRGERADAAVAALNTSVMRIGLLPRATWTDGEGAGVDISGLSDATDQLSPDALPSLAGAGTDELRVERHRSVLRTGNHRPEVDGEAVPAREHLADIERGFVATYRLLEQHRDDLLAPDGPLAAFAEVDLRVVVRPTRRYSLLQIEGRHPDFQRDGLALERFLDRLWIEVAGTPALAPLVEAERADLLRGDVPVFTAHARSRDLFASTGARIPGMLAAAPFARMRDRVAGLGAVDLDRQLWLIRVAFAGPGMSGERESTVPRAVSEYRSGADTATIDREVLLAAVRTIRDRLATTALQGADGPAWLGLRESDYGAQPTLIGLDLYEGLPGVALFLAYLGDATNDPNDRELARQVTETVRSLTARVRDNARSAGAFSGLSGLIYTLTHLGVLWRDYSLLDEAEALVSFLAPLFAVDEDYDIIAGSAGAIMALLALHSVRPSEQTLNAAVLAGDRLLATAEPVAGGLAWTPSGFDRPLTGAAHGAAGIAWALSALSAVSGLARFGDAAHQALAFERARFDPVEGNWPDLRHYEPGEGVLCQTLWCHGAPGIGLTRLLTAGGHDDEAIRAEAQAAVSATLAAATTNDSLCHGVLGNLDLLERWTAITGDQATEQAMNEQAMAVARAAVRGEWQCGTRTGLETPGLMLGIAGIGFGLLRLAFPGRVPSVLALEPPR
jgi:type 2 lantibiotic biosynthesis protein LanM